jgi:uncharacterized protein (DUF305 family)
MRFRTLAAISVTALGALLIAGCSTSSQSNSEYSADDIAFAEMMIPHHEQAVEMSELALLNTSNPEILELAQQIKAAQGPEIELMKSWTGVDASAHAGHTMEGMLSDGEISSLRDAQDKEFDALFLEGMIKHHEGAIEMAQATLSSENQGVAELSASIIEAQKLEISKMKEILTKY